jgi:hypothetical protein
MKSVFELRMPELKLALPRGVGAPGSTHAAKTIPTAAINPQSKKSAAVPSRVPKLRVVGRVMKTPLMRLAFGVQTLG